MDNVRDARQTNTAISRVGIEKWGFTEGREVYLFKLKNSQGSSMDVSNYGAIVKSVFVPDVQGNLNNVVLGYENLDEYIRDPFYIGSIVGRYAGRIADGLFSVDGTEYKLTKTPGGFHHHGGKKGFNKMVWEAYAFEKEDCSGVKLSYTSKDGEEGFPGNLKITVVYTLNDNNEWIVEVEGSTDKTTVVNLTQHSYFNLSGFTGESILDHKLQVHTPWFLPVSEKIIPSGEILNVKDTPFDFLRLRTIGERINNDHPQIKFGDGYDHTWVLKYKNDNTLGIAATLVHPPSGRVLEVYTTEPSVHLYTGNSLGKSKNHPKYNGIARHMGLCLETQHCGNSPNEPAFPTTVLKPGENFQSRTVFRFALK